MDILLEKKILILVFYLPVLLTVVPDFSLLQL